MIDKYCTLFTSDGENVTTANDSKGVPLHSIDLTEDWVTRTRDMNQGKAAAWDIDWSGITSGSGTLTLQFSASGGAKWNTVVREDGVTPVTVTVTGVPTTSTLVAINKCNALTYRWKYVDTDVAGASARVIIYMQVEE